LADSDDTTTLPSVTRRMMLLAGTMAAPATSLFLHGMAAATEALVHNPSFDPALSLWREWKAAYRRTAALCRRQQELETRLANTVGFPQAKVHLPDEDVSVSVSWPADIEELFGEDPTCAGLRAKAEADLAAHQARWDAEDRRIGYSAAKRAEQAAAFHEQELVEILMDTPATTLAGIAGKLDAVLREGETSEECTEFPWPELRAVLCDLVRIGQALQPGTLMSGIECTQPYPRQRREEVCPSIMMYQRGDRMT
jgi:hypothetical protein